MKNRVLVLFAHPALGRSVVNRRLAAVARAVPGVTVHDLYEEYPDFMIDVRREQELLRAHEVILYQHPFYWYSCPALLKEWLDLVLEYNFAYGAEGRALEGKWQASVISTGGRPEDYGREGINRFTVRELLAPFERTAALCRMRWLPPFLVQDSFQVEGAALDGHAADYVKLLEGWREGWWNEEALSGLERLNEVVKRAAPVGAEDRKGKAAGISGQGAGPAVEPEKKF